MSNFPAPPPAWSDIARVCRRVCVLRERGQTDEAERLRAGDLMDMVASIRMPTDTDAAITERLNAIFAVETERVANAAVLAELLAPLLAGQTRPVADAPRLTPSPMVAPATPAAAAAASPSEKPADRRPSGSIADFIDEMIAQETPPPVPRGPQRRAS